MANYLIKRESCWVSPVCVDIATSTQLTVSSLKLAVRGACRRVLILLVIDDTVVFEASFDSPATGLLSFVPPPHILQTTGVLLAYVVLCDDAGRISEIVDYGQTLLFPKDAAAEVRVLFDRICSDAQQFFTLRAPGQQQQVHHQDHAQQQQQQQSSQRGLQQPHAPSLRRALLNLLSAGRRNNSSRTYNADHSSTGSTSGNNSPGSPPSDAATLYAYERFLLPFVHHWAAVLMPKQATSLQLEPSTSTDPVSVDALALRLLHFMLDNDMWASAVLLLDRYPAVCDYVVNGGLELPSDFCNPIVLERKRRSRSLPPMPPVIPLLQPVQLQQQHAALASGQVSNASVASHAPVQDPAQAHILHTHFISPAGFGIIDFSELGPAYSESTAHTEDSSFESASEILRRLLELQQQRSEQEALEQEYLQQQHTSNAFVALQQHIREQSPRQASMQLQCSSATPAAAAEHMAEVGCTYSGNHVGSEGVTTDQLTEDLALTPGGQVGAQWSTDPEEDRTMVPKNRPPRPLHQTLERTSSREEAAALSRLLINIPADTAPPVQGSCPQQQQQQQLHMVPQQQQQQQQQQLFHQKQQQLMQQSNVKQHPAHEAAAAVSLEAPGPPCPAAEQLVHPMPAEVPAGRAAASAAAVAAPQQTTLMSISAVGLLAMQNAVEAAPAQPSTPQSGSSYNSCNSTDSCAMHSTVDGEADCKRTSIENDPADCSSSKLEQLDWHSSCSKPYASPAMQQPASFVQHFAPLLRASFTDFRDSCWEQSYLVFKNHSAGFLDTTALLICSGMLLAAITRSVDSSNHPECWSKLALLLLYGVVFFFPYAVMQFRRQLFLRNREVLLVVSRSLAACIVMLVALGRVPQPEAWLSVVDNTLALQLQNGFILPSCQQLRPHAAALIALAHLPSDMFMIALGRPLASAALQSFLVQLCSVVTAVALDVWCRHRFMQRYLGVTGSDPTGGVQLKPAKAGCCSSSCSGGEINVLGEAGAALRKRQLKQLPCWD